MTFETFMTIGDDLHRIEFYVKRNYTKVYGWTCKIFAVLRLLGFRKYILSISNDLHLYVKLHISDMRALILKILSVFHLREQ